MINNNPKFYQNYKLSNLTWFKTGGPARIFFAPSSEEDLSFALKNNMYKIDNAEYKLFNENAKNKAFYNMNHINMQNQDTIKVPDLQKIITLGACSNVLISDNGIDNIVIKLSNNYSGIKLDEQVKLLIVKSGTLGHSLANFCAQSGIPGFEFLTGIPGTIGGGVCMNAGAYGLEYKDILLSDNTNFPYTVKCINKNGDIRYFKYKELLLSYRNSIFHQLKDYIILEAVFKYEANNSKFSDEIKEKIQAIKLSRSNSQPIYAKTCGSTFTNPSNEMPAWKVIDQLGLRGARVGGAFVSSLHSNFIINQENATSNDILELICKIKNLAKTKMNIILKPEVQFIGFSEQELDKLK